MGVIFRSEGYKATLQQFYVELLGNYQMELVNSYVNAQGKDISDIIRGKILLLQELLMLPQAIELGSDLLKQGADNGVHE